VKSSRSAVGRRTVLAGLGGTLAGPAIVSAQGTYPTKPVRYINPFPAGGATDTLSRLFCAKMSELTGQQWLVENKGGSGGNVGMDALAQSAPDGYSLGLGGIASHAIAPTLYAKLPFKPAHRFHVRIDHVAAAQHAGGQSRASGPISARADRASEEEPEQILLRFGRLGHDAASVGRAVQADGQGRHGPRALPRRRAGDAGPAGGPVST